MLLVLVDMFSDSLVGSYWGVLPFGGQDDNETHPWVKFYNGPGECRAVGKILKRTSVGSAEIPYAECLPDSFSHPSQPSLVPL